MERWFVFCFSFNYTATCGIADSIPANLQRVLDESKPDDVVMICGSLYIMNEVRFAMGIREPQDVIYDYASKDHGPDSVGSSFIYPHEKPLEWNSLVCSYQFLCCMGKEVSTLLSEKPSFCAVFSQ